MLGIAGVLAVVLAGCVQMDVARRGDGFVTLAEAVPDAILEPRYYSTYNFVGERIDGYEEPCALITREAAAALKAASDECVQRGYIAEKSGHSRGSTVDLTLFDMKTGKEVDMGGTFDWFGHESHPDYKNITKEQFANRMLLREIMLAHGFKPIAEEWWHFTLEDEPYPDTYFDFPVR